MTSDGGIKNQPPFLPQRRKARKETRFTAKPQSKYWLLVALFVPWWLTLRLCGDQGFPRRTGYCKDFMCSLTSAANSECRVSPNSKNRR